MNEKTTLKSSTVVISLSIDAELLRRLDVHAAVEDRTRSNMIARMIEFYLDPKHFDFYRDAAMFEEHGYNGNEAGLVKVKLSSVYGKFGNDEKVR